MSRTQPVHAILLLMLAAPVISGKVGTATPPALPDAGTLARGVREAARFDDELQARFTYIEERRDLKISKLGKITVGPLRRFEVYPSSEPGRTWKRLVAIDGKPLEPAELARRDAEHRQDVRDRKATERQESDEERADRLDDEAEAHRSREAMLDDALAVFEPRVLGRETLDGEPVIAVDLTPRPEAHVTTREGHWMKHFVGRVWIAEPGYQIAAVAMRAVDDVSIGWGIVGRIHEGSQFVVRRRKVDGVWLPSEMTFEATGRTLLFRTFDIRSVTRYWGYQRRTDASAR